MSWIDNLRNDFVIVTGDGKEYKPKWKPSTMSTDFNTAIFEFPNVAGSLVVRQQPKGRTIPIELYFDGENHLEESNNFRISADDSRIWRVSHPYYGSIICHPSELNYDNTLYNCTKITGTLLETIETQYPKGSIVPKDKVFFDVENTAETSAFIYSQNATPEAKDMQEMKVETQSLFERAKEFSTSLSDEYNNAYRKANSAITEATQTPLLAMQTMQSMILMPSRFDESVKIRFDILKKQSELLLSNLGGINRRNQKFNFESLFGSVVMGFCLTASTPKQGDFKTQNSIIESINLIINQYNNYLTAIDTLQSPTNGTISSYAPNGTLQTQLNRLVNYTLSNLFDIATGALQLRSFILENDSNWILLTHRLYGIDAADSNIEKLMSENGAGLKEIMVVNKGRKIEYFV